MAKAESPAANDVVVAKAPLVNTATPTGASAVARDEASAAPTGAGAVVRDDAYGGGSRGITWPLALLLWLLGSLVVSTHVFLLGAWLAWTALPWLPVGRDDQGGKKRDFFAQVAQQARSTSPWSTFYYFALSWVFGLDVMVRALPVPGPLVWTTLSFIWLVFGFLRRSPTARTVGQALLILTLIMTNATYLQSFQAGELIIGFDGWEGFGSSMAKWLAGSYRHLFRPHNYFVMSTLTDTQGNLVCVEILGATILKKSVV